jgi:hypothetical protein
MGWAGDGIYFLIFINLRRSLERMYHCRSE